MQNAEKKTKNIGSTCINPTPCAWILHPILHPKLSVNTGHPVPWCRKCRRFSKTFFVEGGKGECDVAVRKMQNIGLLWAKVRMFCLKSTDVFIKEVRCFCFPERVLHSNAFFHESFRGHSHHVWNDIINMVLLHLGDMDVLLWVEILEFGVIDAGAITFAHGYLIFQHHKNSGKGWIANKVSCLDIWVFKKVLPDSNT